MFGESLEQCKAWYRRRRLYVAIFLFLIGIFILGMWPLMFYTIQSGHAGVVYRTFFGGTVTQSVRDEGLQIISPFNSLTIYDVRLQQVEQAFTVISSDGLEVDVVLSIRYHPKVEFLGLLHKKIGPDYLRKVIIPDVLALVRTTFGQYTPEEMYTTKRSLIQETFQAALGNLGDKYVQMDDILIKSISLPPLIQSAIANKLVEQQRMLEMKFRIERETQEAQRKEIEAGGVNRFQMIVGQSITPQLLQYKGIEALASLSASPNAKVILAGGGTNGVPFILDTTTGGGLSSPLSGGAAIPGLSSLVPSLKQEPVRAPLKMPDAVPSPSASPSPTPGLFLSPELKPPRPSPTPEPSPVPVNP